MRAFDIIRCGGFDPDQLARLEAIFANAWKELSNRYATVQEESREDARERLARIVVTLGTNTRNDAWLIAVVIAAFEEELGSYTPEPAK
jgi:hypothetical protein